MGKKKYYNYDNDNTTETIDETTNEEVTTEEVVTENITEETAPVEESVVEDAPIETVKEKKEESVVNTNINGEDLTIHYTSGRAINLNKTKVYATSKSRIVNTIVTGKYYIVNGNAKDGRYRITSAKSANPKYCIGFVNKEDIK